MANAKLYFENNTFRCHLHCQRCQKLKPNGQRCKNRVCMGVPFCWVHNKQYYGLQIRDSQFGKGLFATRNMPNGHWICPYVGEVITEACLNLRYPGHRTAPYAVNDTCQDIDSACRRGIAAMANGLFRGTRSRARAVHHAILEYRHAPFNTVWIRAIRDINIGEEIFVHYGSQYRLGDYHITRRGRGADTRPC